MTHASLRESDEPAGASRVRLGAAAAVVGAEGPLAGLAAEVCLEAVMGAAEIGIAICDAEHRFVRVSPALARINGMPPEAHLGQRVREILPITGEQIEEILERVIRGGEAVRGVRWDVLLPGEAGDHRFFVGDYHPVRAADGRVTGTLVLLTETTEQTRAERRAEELAARVRAVVDGIPDVANVYDAEWRWTHMNPAAVAWLRSIGREPEALIGRRVWEEFPEVVGTSAHEAGLQAMREGREVVFESFEEALDAHFETRIIPIVGGVVSLSREITERKRAERELERAKELAEQASRAKSQFLAVMSHELRTPLNAILGYQDLLDAEVVGTLNPRQKEYLGRIRDSAEQLVELIGQILGLSRIEAGKEEVDPSWFDIVGLAARCVALVEPAASKKALAVRTLSAETRLMLHTDAAKARQIVLNLLSNAVKFTEAGEIVLSVERDAGWVRVEVRDSGIGIAPADQERVFEPFTQVDDSSTRRQGGTGLGLTVSRRLARLLGGDLTVRSAPGEGSAFTLTLPDAPVDGASGRG